MPYDRKTSPLGFRHLEVRRPGTRTELGGWAYAYFALGVALGRHANIHTGSESPETLVRETLGGD